MVRESLFAISQAVSVVCFLAGRPFDFAQGRRGCGADGPQKIITPVGHLFIAVSVCSVGWYFL